MPTIGQAALQIYARKFPISRGKHRVVSKLWKPFSAGRYIEQAELRCGARVICDTRQYLQRELFFFGDYEPECSALWSKRSHTASVVFDVGANIGFYSLLAARANPRAEVHAFEPTPDIAAHLERHKAMNELANITVNNVGVGRVPSTARLRPCLGNEGTNDGMNFVVDSDATREAGDIDIDVVSLDSYCAERNIRRIDLLKIDVEGAEYDVLSGAQELLRKQAVDCLLVEFIGWAADRRGHTASDLRQLLEGHGYKLFTLRGGTLVPVRETPDGENVVALASS